VCFVISAPKAFAQALAGKVGSGDAAAVSADYAEALEVERHRSALQVADVELKLEKATAAFECERSRLAAGVAEAYETIDREAKAVLGEAMPCLPDRGSWLPPGASADAQLAGLVGELAVLSVSALLVARMGARAMERSAKDFCDAVAAAAEEEGCGRARAEASDASGGDRESTSANACASLTDDSATLPQLSHAAALHLQQALELLLGREAVETAAAVQSLRGRSRQRELSIHLVATGQRCSDAQAETRRGAQQREHYLPVASDIRYLKDASSITTQDSTKRKGIEGRRQRALQRTAEQQKQLREARALQNEKCMEAYATIVYNGSLVGSLRSRLAPGSLVRGADQVDRGVDRAKREAGPNERSRLTPTRAPSSNAALRTASPSFEFRSTFSHQTGSKLARRVLDSLSPPRDPPARGVQHYQCLACDVSSYRRPRSATVSRTAAVGTEHGLRHTHSMASCQRSPSGYAGTPTRPRTADVRMSRIKSTSSIDIE